ncbi:MAG: dinitrogenase iron-molybdenum cofactor [Aciduliprofundum sp.]|nr:MAG: dinitrogenase iron-molybdenum cofactor [Aciduliprofundum sp.]
MRKLRISVGMQDENLLYDGHYGDSSFFLIFDLDENGNCVFVERRENTKIEEHSHGDINKFNEIIRLLRDVDVLVAYRMGPNFINIRERSNKVPFLTRTRDFNESLEMVRKNFENLWNEKRKKSEA